MNSQTRAKLQLECSLGGMALLGGREALFTVVKRRVGRSYGADICVDSCLDGYADI